MALREWGDTPQTRENIKNFNESLDVMKKANESGDLSDADLKAQYRAINTAMGVNVDDAGNVSTNGENMIGAEGSNGKQKINMANDMASKFEDVANGANNNENGGDGRRNAGSFNQGKQGTCGTESAQKVEAHNDPGRYANELTAAIEDGVVMRGGLGDNPPRKVELHSSAFSGDNESLKQWDEGEKTMGINGQAAERGSAGRLGDYIRGQELADRGAEDPAIRAHLKMQPGDKMVYKQGGMGQTDDGEGTYVERANGGADSLVTDSPLATDKLLADMAADNGRTLMIHESQRSKLGNHKGITYFNAENLNQKLQEATDKTGHEEHQILTNGAYILGRNEHGKHAQTARAGDNGNAVFFNQWGGKYANVQYSKGDLNRVTNPNADLPEGGRKPTKRRWW